MSELAIFFIKQTSAYEMRISVWSADVCSSDLGERRFRAARIAGLTEVPVLVREVPDEGDAVMTLIENIQREDLNPLEEAQGVRRLLDEFGRTEERRGGEECVSQ